MEIKILIESKIVIKENEQDCCDSYCPYYKKASDYARHGNICNLFNESLKEYSSKSGAPKRLKLCFELVEKQYNKN